jgi:tRNA G18 (ribose-2'-O)-methylase SpoU
VNVVRVDSTADARVSGYALLADERALRERGWFVAEGRFVVERLIAGRRHDIVSLLVNDAALAALAPLASDLAAPIYVCAPRFFESLTGHHFHRGCLALARRPAAAAPLELARGARSLLLLDRVGNPDNVGSIFRSGLALGVDAIWLGPGCADPYGRKALRTSMAAALALPWATFAAAEPWLESVARLGEHGFALLALSPRPPATDVRELVREGVPERFALLLGAEGDGLAPELEALAARRLQIAMRAGVDSLNVGVAAGIALHALLGPR